MNRQPHVRLMNQGDLSFADSLRALAGWNQTLENWQSLLALAPAGCFIAEWNGSPAGTVTTTCYGAELAWIGMMLVHPKVRRHGIGTALMKHCLDYLHQRGIRCVKLDATPLGKPLYENLGFRDEWPLTRWQAKAASSLPQTYLQPTPAMRAEEASDNNSAAEITVSTNEHVRTLTDADWNAMVELDTPAFGANRRNLIAALGSAGGRILISETEPGWLTGYGMRPKGSGADHLGPVVATSISAATALVNALLADAWSPGVYWDIPDPNIEAIELARTLRFTPQRPLMRMYLGENLRPGNPLLQYAIADPAVG